MLITNSAKNSYVKPFPKMNSRKVFEQNIEWLSCSILFHVEWWGSAGLTMKFFWTGNILFCGKILEKVVFIIFFLFFLNWICLRKTSFLLRKDYKWPINLKCTDFDSLLHEECQAIFHFRYCFLRRCFIAIGSVCLKAKTCS